LKLNKNDQKLRVFVKKFHNPRVHENKIVIFETYTSRSIKDAVRMVVRKEDDTRRDAPEKSTGIKQGHEGVRPRENQNGATRKENYCRY